jgi:multidrug transporter EmrE-like cation transporter
MTLFQFAQIFFIGAVNAVAQIFLKKADIKEFNFSVLTNKFVWAGALLYVGAFWLWVKVVNELELSIAVPLMTGIMYVLVVFSAWYFFKESITMLKFLGICLVAFGVFFLTKK